MTEEAAVDGRSIKYKGGPILENEQWSPSETTDGPRPTNGSEARGPSLGAAALFGDRMMDGLELESRRRIYEFLLQNPGIHLRRIGQILGMSTGMLSYHLGVLERTGLLKSEELGHRKRYFIARAFADVQRRILGVLREDVPRKIVMEILQYGQRSFAELQAAAGVSKSTLSYHLQKLLGREILLRSKRGRESVFLIKDMGEVVDILVANRRSFHDDAVDRFVDTWGKLRA